MRRTFERVYDCGFKLTVGHAAWTRKPVEDQAWIFPRHLSLRNIDLWENGQQSGTTNWPGSERSRRDRTRKSTAQIWPRSVSHNNHRRDANFFVYHQLSQNFGLARPQFNHKQLGMLGFNLLMTSCIFMPITRSPTDSHKPFYTELPLGRSTRKR